MQGKIIKIISNDYTVLAGTQNYVCKSRGKFRLLGITPLVGDYVLFDEKECYIHEILPRKNELIRPPICNVDQALVITSAKSPDFSSNLLDKLLVTIEYNNIRPIICFTKLDLLTAIEKEKINNYINYYRKIGYKVYENSDEAGMEKVLSDKITVLTGQSGAGKSTLLNRLDPMLHLATDEISHALGRGKHTTRHVELLPLFGGYIADTPGFSSLNFDQIPKVAIRDNFIEFNDYKEECEYRDCMHDQEPHCGIKKHVDQGDILNDRYQNYLNFIKK